MTNVSLSGALLEEAVFVNVDLSTVDMSRVLSFNKAVMHNTTWPEKVILTGVTFHQTDLSWSTFGEETVLNEADFRLATLYRVNFNGASLRRADFDRATLDGTDLTGADLTEAKLVEIDMTKIVFDRTTTFTLTDMREAVFTSMTLNDIDFSTTRLVRAEFTEALLDNVLFDNADAQRAIFRKTRIEDGKFRNTDLRNADFTEARLQDALLTGAEVRNTKFIRTDLTGADFDGAGGLVDAEWSRTTCPDGRKSDNCYRDDALDPLR